MERVTYYRDDTLWIESFGCVLVSVNTQPPTVAGVRRVTAAFDELSPSYPSGVAIVIVPSADRPALSVEVGREIGETWDRIMPRLACAVVWVRRGGFIGAAVRSLVTGLLLVRPRSLVPIAIASSLQDVAHVVSSHTSVPGATVRESVQRVVAPKLQ
ncbi:MAG: hypothetical protein AAGE52_22020 [Myxococcota bacterium]